MPMSATIISVRFGLIAAISAVMNVDANSDDDDASILQSERSRT